MRYFCRPPYRDARVAELVDARDSNSRSARSVGSIPTPGTEKALQTRGFFVPHQLVGEGGTAFGYLAIMNGQLLPRLRSLALALTVAATASAQIVVNEGDLPAGGNAYTFQNFTPDPFLNLESSGPGQVWDFSDLDLIDSTVVDVQDIGSASFFASLVFNSPLDPTHQADHFYPFLNLPDLGDAGLPIDIDQINGFHQLDGEMYTQVGLSVVVQGNELPVAFSDVDEVHPVPVTIDMQHSSTASYVVEVPFTLTYAVDQTRDAVVDGYGTLLLPDGTSHEVLRMVSTVSSSDSAYINALEQGLAFERNTVTYSWLGNGGMPYLEIATTLGFPAVARYQGSAPYTEPVDTSTSSTNEAPRLVSEWRVAPNPAESGRPIRIQGVSGTDTWTLMDAMGHVMFRGQGAELETTGLPSGMYLLRDETTSRVVRVVIRQ